MPSSENFDNPAFIDPACRDAWLDHLSHQNWALAPELTPQSLLELRRMSEIDFEAVAKGRPFHRADHRITSGASVGYIDISVISPAQTSQEAPILLHLHGGGTALGNRFSDIARVLDWVDELSVVVISVEYRLSPECPYPASLDDAAAALAWLDAHALELGVDPGRIFLVGESAGGCLAAGLALRARDEGLTAIAGLLLMCPMLDDRTTGEPRPGGAFGPWSAASNATAWDFYLGAIRGTDDVPPYAAPGRATNLEGLPRLYIDVGSADVLAREAVEFATRLWSCGGEAELHVWPGGYHSFDEFAPEAAISVSAAASRSSWLRRALA